jgi:hypothetical protein
MVSSTLRSYLRRAAGREQTEANRRTEGRKPPAIHLTESQRRDVLLALSQMGTAMKPYCCRNEGRKFQELELRSGGSGWLPARSTPTGLEPAKPAQVLYARGAGSSSSLPPVCPRTLTAKRTLTVPSLQAGETDSYTSDGFAYY